MTRSIPGRLRLRSERVLAGLSVTTLFEYISTDGEFWMVKTHLEKSCSRLLVYCAVLTTRKTCKEIQYMSLSLAIIVPVFARHKLIDLPEFIFFLQMCPIPALRKLLPFTTSWRQDSAVPGFILPRVNQDSYRVETIRGNQKDD